MGSKKGQSTDHMNKGKDPNADLGTTATAKQRTGATWRDTSDGSDADNNGYANRLRPGKG